MKFELAIWVITVLAISSVAFCIDDKCAACNAVAVELERGLSNEKPRNHLDMRHRLDSKGQRKGKVIDYRVSELRVVELLDDLCDKMQDYTLEEVGPKKRAWVRVDNWDNLITVCAVLLCHIKRCPAHVKGRNKVDKIDKKPVPIRKIYQPIVEGEEGDKCRLCHRWLIEETEDELAELIKEGSVKVGEVSKVLCQDLSKHCSQTSRREQTDNDNHERADGDL